MAFALVQGVWNRRRSAVAGPSGKKPALPPVTSSDGMDIERELAAIHRSFLRAYVRTQRRMRRGCTALVNVSYLAAPRARYSYSPSAQTPNHGTKQRRRTQH